MEKTGMKKTMNRKLNRPLGWGIMGSVLIIIFTLAVIGACAAAENKGGMVAMLVIGCIALAVCVIAAIVDYRRLARNGELEQEEAIEPASKEEEAPVAVQQAAEEAYEQPEVVVAATAYQSKADEVEVAEEAPALFEEDEAGSEEEIAEAEAPVADQATDVEIVADEAEDTVAEGAAEEIAEEPIEEAVPEAPDITPEDARGTMSNEEALSRVEGTRTAVNGPMCTVYVGVLSGAFASGEVVTLEALQAKGLVPRKETGYIVLAKGSINKALTVKANDFSADAVKMILAAGGKAIGC